jgi:hypothetical protein
MSTNLLQSYSRVNELIINILRPTERHVYCDTDVRGNEFVKRTIHNEFDLCELTLLVAAHDAWMPTLDLFSLVVV